MLSLRYLWCDVRHKQSCKPINGWLRLSWVVATKWPSSCTLDASQRPLHSGSTTITHHNIWRCWRWDRQISILVFRNIKIHELKRWNYLNLLLIRKLLQNALVRPLLVDRCTVWRNQMKSWWITYITTAISLFRFVAFSLFCVLATPLLNAPLKLLLEVYSSFKHLAPLSKSCRPWHFPKSVADV